MRNGLRIATLLLLFLALMPARLYAAAVHVGFLRVILTATAMPGGQRDTYFINFSAPSINSGRVVFYGLDNHRHGGVYNNLYNYVQLVADYLTKLPESNSRFSNFSTLVDGGDVPLINHRMIVFKGLGGINRVGLYRFFKNKLSVIVSARTVMPGNKKETFEDFSDPWLLNDASVVFIGSAGHDHGIFAVDHRGRLKLLMNINQTTIPQGKGTFTKVRDLAMSPQGGEQNYAFIGEGEIKAEQPYGIRVHPSKKSKKIPLQNQEIGIYMSHPVADGKVALEKIADKNSKIPQGLGYFTTFSHLSFDKNQVAFIGGGILGSKGVYISAAQGKRQLIKIADLKMIPPQADSQYAHFDEVVLHNGLVVFHAETKDKMKGLFLYTPQYGLFKLLSTRDRVDNKEIADVHIGRDGFSGRNLGLLVKFTDGARAVYVATVSVSPY